jgi:hypothetical protein
MRTMAAAAAVPSPGKKEENQMRPLSSPSRSCAFADTDI